MGAKSDPICASSGCTQYKHKKKELPYKIDYTVPHFGKDLDIRHSEESALDAEKALGHVFTPEWDDEDEKWIVPTETAEFKLASTGEDVHMGHFNKQEDFQSEV